MLFLAELIHFFTCLEAREREIQKSKSNENIDKFDRWLAKNRAECRIEEALSVEPKKRSIYDPRNRTKGKGGELWDMGFLEYVDTISKEGRLGEFEFEVISADKNFMKNNIGADSSLIDLEFGRVPEGHERFLPQHHRTNLHCPSDPTFLELLFL